MFILYAFVICIRIEQRVFQCIYVGWNQLEVAKMWESGWCFCSLLKSAKNDRCGGNSSASGKLKDQSLNSTTTKKRRVKLKYRAFVWRGRWNYFGHKFERKRQEEHWNQTTSI